MKITTNITLTGTEYPITVDVSKEINALPNPNERMDKVLDFLLEVDLTEVNLSDWYIAEFRNKMIALNGKFRFKSIDVNETFTNFMREMGEPKI